MSTPITVHLCLTPELDRFVRDRLASEQDQNIGDLVREGLELLRKRESEQRHALHDLKAKLNQGVEQARRGQLLEGDQVIREIRTRAAARRNRRAS